MYSTPMEITINPTILDNAVIPDVQLDIIIILDEINIRQVVK